jgi:hypothetical protein
MKTFAATRHPLGSTFLLLQLLSWHYAILKRCMQSTSQPLTQPAHHQQLLYLSLQLLDAACI